MVIRFWTPPKERDEDVKYNVEDGKAGFPF
jgi:hypothetical protein